MSIIVVSIGDESNFEDLRKLDKNLQGHGKEVQRDMVEFVSFNSFFTEGGDLRTAGAHLARKALAKVPEHIATFKVIA